MASPGLGNVLQYLRDVVAPPEAGPVGDARLLERFLGQRDEAAFAALVRRHAGLVLGVARTVLNDPHTADDVFQATFLVLARKAHSLRKRESLASWLYGVAYRIALNARVRAARRRKHERRVVPMPTQPATDDTSRELRPLVVEELNRLPEKYRAPLVLCYLEGLTNEEAAEQLRWPSGTVKGRLARARDVLRGRLAKRGLALTATALTAALANNGVSAAVPATLLTNTLQLTVPVALGNTSLRAVAGSAAELARQTIRETLVARVATVTVAVLALAAGGVGALWLVSSSSQPPAATAEPELPPLGEPRLLAVFSDEKHYQGVPLPLALSADGKRLAVLVQKDTEAGELLLQEIATGARLASVKIEEGFRTAAADRKALALVYAADASAETRVELRDLASLKLIREWKDDQGSVQPVEGFLAGDSLVLTGGHADAAMAPPGNFGNFGGFPAAGFPPAGFGPFGFGLGASALGLYDLRGKDKPVVQALADEDTLVAAQLIAPAGKLSVVLLLKRDDESRVELLDPMTGKTRKLIEQTEATALAASGNGKVIALQTAENAVQLWDAAAGRAGPLLRDGDTTIVCFVLSADGRLLATAGSDRCVKLWETQTGRLARQLVQPRVQRLLFAADGRTLVSASPEEVKVWELRK